MALLRTGLLAALLSTALVLLLPAAAHASLVLELSVPELTARAALVVVGTVGRPVSAATRSGRIVTRTPITIGAVWKGTPPEALVVRRLGGTFEGVGQRVEGEVELREGEQVVLFLEPVDGGEFRTVGLSQGKFAVSTVAGRLQAAQSLEGLAVLRRSGGEPEAPASLKRELGGLEAEVRAAARGATP